MTRALGLVTAAIITLSIWAGTGAGNHLEAQGIIDQAWDGTIPPGHGSERSWQNIQLQAPLGMEFTPSQSTLVGVDVWIEGTSFGYPTPSATIGASIREDTVTGPVLGTSSVDVPVGVWGFVHFDFAPAISLTPGNVYVIELTSSDVEHGWVGQEASPKGDGYPGGEPIILGERVPNGTDFLFRTYAAGVKPTETATATTTPTPTPSRTPLSTAIGASPTQPEATVTPANARLPATGSQQEAMHRLSILSGAFLAASAGLLLAFACWVMRRRSR